MDFLMAVHKALDYFFCDRCPTEVVLPNGRVLNGRWISKVIDKLCPIQFLFKLLPEEEHVNPRRIYFPRSWMEGTTVHYEEEGQLREA